MADRIRCARKICAIGVGFASVAIHGFALNVNADLGYFDNIIWCGIRRKAVSTLNVELGVEKVDEAENSKRKNQKIFLELF